MFLTLTFSNFCSNFLTFYVLTFVLTFLVGILISGKMVKFRQNFLEARADYEAVLARSAKSGLTRAIADLDGKIDGEISADAAGPPRPSVGVDFQEEICAELSTSAVSPSPVPTNSIPLSQLPSGDSALESEDLSALNSQAFPAVIAAEPVAPLPGTQQVASSTALSTPNSLASASSGMSPR